MYNDPKRSNEITLTKGVAFGFFGCATIPARSTFTTANFLSTRHLCGLLAEQALYRQRGAPGACE